MIIEVPDPKDLNYYCSSCSKCCNDNVPIHPAEVLELSKYTGLGVKRLVQEERSENHFWLRYDQVKNTCIFLEDGRCSIYERRPVVCRKFPVNFAAVLGDGLVTAIAHNPWNESCIGLPEKNESTLRRFSEQDFLYIIEKSLIHRAVRASLNGLSRKSNMAQEAYSLFNSLSLDDAVDVLRKGNRDVIIM